MSSSSRARSSSPFSYRKPSTPSPYSSTSSSSSYISARHIPRSSPTSTSCNNSRNGLGSLARTTSRDSSDSVSKGGARTPVRYPPEELIGETGDLRKSGGDSISVTIRFRPLSEREYQRGDEVEWYADGDGLVRNEYNPAIAYAFDRVFGEQASSPEVYEVAASPVIKAAMEGVNGTVFAYGVTSSGKTHTMHGNHNSPGIIPLAIKEVFSIIQDTPGREFLLRVSYLEIYNEVINDLLDPRGQNLRVREDSQGTYVEGMKEEVVLSPGHALSFIAAGEEHRHVGSNNFNLFSSRSHTIFTLMIESSAHGDEYDGVIFSQLNLIDLAGSESSKTETTGIRRKEGSYINKSLLTLGTVIGKLSEGKASHVPYRDSKLTRLLQSSLSAHGHVSLICTVTPACSSTEETHNTLKFASRAKRVEIYASRNKIIDEKSLIKKYQREISTLKEELDQLRRGVLAGVSHEEILTLKQKLKEGQVKMQSRLEEEEEAKAALMSRIQRLTKLILVSTKSSIPGCLSDASMLQSNHSFDEDDKLDGENQDLSSSLVLQLDPSFDFKHIKSSNKCTEVLSSPSSTVTNLTQAGELTSSSRMTAGALMSDQMELLVEQVKMLSEEIALSTSTLKRLVEQSINDPDNSKTQIQNLEQEIQEKRRQMRVLEQNIRANGEASTANSSLIDMQQTVMRLMTQCNEKSFELEITSADNRILQDQLQNKCVENNELQIKVNFLEQRLATYFSEKPSLSYEQQRLSTYSSEKPSLSSERGVSEKYGDELRKKIQCQEIENEKLKLVHVQLSEENSGLHVQNQKLAEEASYAKELASAAAIELKNLASEVTKLALQNAKLEKDLLVAKELVHSRNATKQTANGLNRKYSDGLGPGRKGRLSGRYNENLAEVGVDFDSYNLDVEDLKLELQARKQHEAALEASLAGKKFLEEEYKKKIEEAKKKEEVLENDLANMWVLVARLRKEAGANSELNTNEKHANAMDLGGIKKTNEIDNNPLLRDSHVLEVPKQAEGAPNEEPLVAQLKARMRGMREKELRSCANGDGNSHDC